ncbi:hypothetical protein DAPPUDRAFT_241428 [Daphnia pulex]|uniref:Uncharacterized protein n=1 Tax=Daphnia pulex TaxID=6669 RepID=E9GE86_DAPPU|nr:hypothetical protein DAPPUDRAFT_241428 [Daphnia pulex]|eukprot:EFX82356.1 hypothetical protein DAPPUDRAFT_241428 [Daphnia pulex]
MLASAWSSVVSYFFPVKKNSFTSVEQNILLNRQPPIQNQHVGQPYPIGMLPSPYQYETGFQINQQMPTYEWAQQVPPPPQYHQAPDSPPDQFVASPAYGPQETVLPEHPEALQQQFHYGHYYQQPQQGPTPSQSAYETSPEYVETVPGCDPNSCCSCAAMFQQIPKLERRLDQMERENYNLHQQLMKTKSEIDELRRSSDASRNGTESRVGVENPIPSMPEVGNYNPFYEAPNSLDTHIANQMRHLSVALEKQQRLSENDCPAILPRSNQTQSQNGYEFGQHFQTLEEIGEAEHHMYTANWPSSINNTNAGRPIPPMAQPRLQPMPGQHNYTGFPNNQRNDVDRRQNFEIEINFEE